MPQHPSKQKEYKRAYDRKRRRKLKKEVLTHYGKNGELKCCWRGCQVKRLAMLTLDHSDNSGAVFREIWGRQSDTAYRFVKDYGYPKGYRTLCFNHNGLRQIKRYDKD